MDPFDKFAGDAVARFAIPQRNRFAIWPLIGENIVEGGSNTVWVIANETARTKGDRHGTLCVFP